MVLRYRKNKARNTGYVEHRGRRRAFPGAYNSRQSRDAYADFLKSIRAPDEAPRGNCFSTVCEFLFAYLLHAEDYYGNNPTEFSHLKRVADVVSELYPSERLSAFGPLSLKKCRQKFVDDGAGRAHANAQARRIVRIWKWGVAEEWVKPEVLVALQALAPLRKGKTTAAESKPVKPVAWKHVRKVLPLVVPQVAAMVRIHWLTGMRSGSLCGMRPMDIDRRGKTWVYEPPHHKGTWRDDDLRIPLGPTAQKILAPFMNRPVDAYLFSPREGEQWRRAKKRATRKTKVQPSQKSRSRPNARQLRDWYTTDTYRRAITYAIKRFNKSAAEGRKCPPWHPHQLRHSRGTRVRRLYGVEAAQAALGHMSVEATQIYAERDFGLARRIAGEIG